jgi:hypothetical protein
VKQFRIRADGARIAGMRHAQEFRIALIAALALFFAQMGAMAHAYSHAPESSNSSSQQSNLGIHDFCKDCLNFAPLLSAAGTPDVLPFALPLPCRSEPQAQITRLVDLKFRLAFRSRAPPVSP